MLSELYFRAAEKFGSGVLESAERDAVPAWLLAASVVYLVLVIAYPLFCWLVGWDWWIGLVAAAILVWPLVEIGGPRRCRALGSSERCASRDGYFSIRKAGCT